MTGARRSTYPRTVIQREYQDSVDWLAARVRERFGSRLVAIVLYGSVARGAARPESDVDLLLVMRELPSGPRNRRMLISDLLDSAEKTLQETLPHASVSVVMKTPEEVGLGGPLFYDMTLPGEVELLYDPEALMKGFLGDLRARMAALGSRRLSYHGHPYWDLKPDWKPGDVIDL